MHDLCNWVLFIYFRTLKKSADDRIYTERYILKVHKLLSTTVNNAPRACHYNMA